LDVYSCTASAGWGRGGARVVPWTYVCSRQLFASKAVDWPSTRTANVSIEFSTADPSGAAPRLLELSGEAHRADGSRVPPGARVEAFVQSTLSGVASVRTCARFDRYVVPF